MGRAGNNELVTRTGVKRKNGFFETHMESFSEINGDLFRYFDSAVFWLLSVPAGAYQGVEFGRDCRSGDDTAPTKC